jgi:hypothetical protein
VTDKVLSLPHVPAAVLRHALDVELSQPQHAFGGAVGVARVIHLFEKLTSGYGAEDEGMRVLSMLSTCRASCVSFFQPRSCCFSLAESWLSFLQFLLSHRQTAKCELVYHRALKAVSNPTMFAAKYEAMK